MLAGLIAFLMSTLAAFLVHYSWRRGNIAWVAAAGWLLAFGSTVMWSRVLGSEFGLTYAIIVFVCLVWLAVAFTMEGRRPDEPALARQFRKLHRPGMQDYVKHGMLFILSVPAAGVTAMLLSVALVLNLPWSMPLQMAVAIFLYPLLWGALSAWICAQDKLLKPMLANAGMLAVSSLVLFM